MRACPVCLEPFDSSLKVCPNDGHTLSEADTLIGRVVDNRFRVDLPLGKGGMGTVYRATQLNLNRTVALKIIRDEVLGNAVTVERFKREAYAAARLKHPHIVTVYDYGIDQSVGAFIVMEHLSGVPLNEEIHRRGRLPVGHALRVMRDVCSAVQTAHEAGLIHRDLKPHNIFLETTPEGRIAKVLDFGIAKAQDGGGDVTLTATGAMLGTPLYMSPEMANGVPLDARSDVYSLGCVLFEMLTGSPPFVARSAPALILKHMTEPPRLPSEVEPEVPAMLDAILLKALAKEPSERFQSAGELGRALASTGSMAGFDVDRGDDPWFGETLASGGAPAAFAPTETVARTEIAETALAPAPPKPESPRTETTDDLPRAAVTTPLPRAQPKRRLGVAAVAVAAAAALVAASFVAGRRSALPASPTFQKVTYRRGTVWSARLAPDGHTVVYSASWDGGPIEIYTTSPETTESRPRGLEGCDLLAVSRMQELAILLNASVAEPIANIGTLARVPLAGGVPREVLENVLYADFSPDGKQLAVVHQVEDRCRLEYPIGTVLFETTGWLSHLRVSPDGERLAFVSHPEHGDNRGSVMTVTTGGESAALSPEMVQIQGLSWGPDGREIWFSGADTGVSRRLFAVGRDGTMRKLAPFLGGTKLYDVAGDRTLLAYDDLRAGLVGLPPGATPERERDLSWLDYSFAADLTADGKTVLFSEMGAAGGSTYAVYMRTTEGSPAVRLGEGKAMALSPDGKWVLTSLNAAPPRLMLLPTGAGVARELERGGIAVYTLGSWFPDGRRIVFAGSEPGKGSRLYVQDVDGGAPVPVTPEGTNLILAQNCVSPDGRSVFATGPDGRITIYPLDGGESRPVPGLEPGAFAVRWGADGRSLYTFKIGKVPMTVYLVDVATGERKSWRELNPPDPSGIVVTVPVLVTPDGAAYAYSYLRESSELHLVQGME
jgi:eukaryotic-like serine/threonine-protein kinase